MSIHCFSQSPCGTDQYQEFDFWLGQWETYVDGKLAGTNFIHKIEDGCVIKENWYSANGSYTGTSLNFFDEESKKWTQVWVDNQGDHLHLTGGLVNGNMVLQSATPESNDAAAVNHRITWTPNADGSVRQLWESSKDGKEWTIAFNGLYIRAN